MIAFTRSRSGLALVLCTFFSFVSTHTVITYPGWRGNNLHTNGTDLLESTGGLGVGPNNTYPYGMQWMYPCEYTFSPAAASSTMVTHTSCLGGGMPLTTNRTKWPFNGGAIAMQPGWFPGHSFALFYINLGESTVPGNFSLNMVPAFQIAGPSNNQFDGSFCLPQVPLPANFTAKIGDNATIQVVETAQHGAALYSVSPGQIYK